MESILNFSRRIPIKLGQVVKTVGGGPKMRVVAIDFCGHELIATCVRGAGIRQIQDFYSVEDLEPLIVFMMG